MKDKAGKAEKDCRLKIIILLTCETFRSQKFVAEDLSLLLYSALSKYKHFGSFGGHTCLVSMTH
jgi:hypothetical protein